MLFNLSGPALPGTRVQNRTAREAETRICFLITPLLNSREIADYPEQQDVLS
jgi:hypothetical protein